MTGSAKYQEALRIAEGGLWSAFQKADIFNHNGDRGDVREAAVRSFLESHLPARFAVEQGEIIDTLGNRSGQIDVLIFDRDQVSPIASDPGGPVVIGAEGLLAVVEVKTMLSSVEAGRIASGRARLWALRPWQAPFALIAGKEGKTTHEKLPRVYSTVLAFRTDLAAGTWAQKELERFREALGQAEVPATGIDLLAVLERGLLNIGLGTAVEPPKERVLGEWFFSLANFLERESGRRSAYPLNDYHHPLDVKWRKVAPAEFNVPPAAPLTQLQRRKMRSKARRGL